MGEGSSYRESTVYVWRATVKKETIKIGSHKSEITYIQVDGITHIINASKWRKWKRWHMKISCEVQCGFFKDSNVNNILIMIFFTTFSIKISCFHISHNKKTQTSTGYCYPAPQGKSCLPKPGEWGQFLMIEWLIYLKPDNKKIEWNAFFSHFHHSRTFKEDWHCWSVLQETEMI